MAVSSLAGVCSRYVPKFIRDVLAHNRNSARITASRTYSAQRHVPGPFRGHVAKATTCGLTRNSLGYYRKGEV